MSRNEPKKAGEEMGEQELTKAQKDFLGVHEGGMSIDDFLNHSGRGSGGDFLSGDWKKKKQIKVWLHKGHKIHAVWFHGFYKAIEVKDRESGGKKWMVVSIRFNCRDHHPEQKNGDKLLKKSRFRDETGAREHAPILCPQCLMEDWLAVKVRAGEIGFTQEIFKFADPNGDKALVLHAGGILGFYDDKKMSPEEKVEVRRAKISMQEAWKEKTLPRLNYLLVLVPDEEPEDGAKKFFAPEALGEKLKTTVRKEMDRRPKNKEKGNPILNPYPLVFRYDEDQSFDKKYDVDALEEEPSDEVLSEIDGEMLDLSQELEPGNCRELRMLMEQHALIDMPFDDFFAPAEKEGLMRGDDRREKREDAAGAREEKPAAPRFVCDACDGKNLPDNHDVECPDCGAAYDKDCAIVGMLCLNEACKITVRFEPGTTGRVECPACGQPHDLSFETQNADSEDEYEKPVWKALPRAAKEEPKKPGRGRRAKKQATEAGA